VASCHQTFKKKKNLSPASTSPAINLCHRKPVIGSIVDTGNKFITGVVDTAAQSLPVTMTPAINLSTTLVNNDRWLRHL
jgi:hypothetical protein